MFGWGHFNVFIFSQYIMCRCSSTHPDSVPLTSAALSPAAPPEEQNTKHQGLEEEHQGLEEEHQGLEEEHQGLQVLKEDLAGGPGGSDG